MTWMALRQPGWAEALKSDYDVDAREAMVMANTQKIGILVAYCDVCHDITCLSWLRLEFPGLWQGRRWVL